MPKKDDDAGKINENQTVDSSVMPATELETGQMAVEAQRAQAAEADAQKAAGVAAAESLQSMGPDASTLAAPGTVAVLDPSLGGVPINAQAEIDPITGRSTPEAMQKLHDDYDLFDIGRQRFSGVRAKALHLLKRGVTAAELKAECAVSDAEHFVRELMRGFGLQFEAEGTGDEKSYKLIS